MAYHHTVADAFDTRPRPPARAESSDAFAGGFLLAVLGYTLAICVFTWAAFYRGGANPRDTLTTALGILVTIGSAITMALFVAAVVGFRRRPRRSAGLIAGMIIGLLLGLVFFLPTASQLPNVGTQCACAPIIDQLPNTSR